LKTLQIGAVLKHVTGPLWMLVAWNNSGGKKQKNMPGTMLAH